MKVQKAREALSTINRAITELGDSSDQAKTKVAYWLLKAKKKIGKKLETVEGDYLERKEDVQVKFSATDNDGILLKEEDGSYRYSKEDIKKLNGELRKIWRLHLEDEIDDPEIALDISYFKEVDLSLEVLIDLQDAGILNATEEEIISLSI